MTEIKVEGKTITLTLRQKNGKEKTVVQDYVPSYKEDEYYELMSNLQKNAEKEKREISNIEVLDMHRNFFSSLFDDESINYDALKNGLDTLDNEEMKNAIRYRVLAFDKEEDELAKKLQKAQLLAGVKQEIDIEN